MTAAELRLAREWLGLTVDALAGLLRVDERTVRRWEAGAQPMPDPVAERVRELLVRAEFDLTWRVVNALDAERDAPGRVSMVTFRTDAEHAAARPREAAEGFTAGYHRAVTARAWLDTPGTRVVWAGDPDAGAPR